MFYPDKELIYKAARYYVGELGFDVIPLGTKLTPTQTWKDSGKTTLQDVEEWFGKGQNQFVNIAILTGQRSGITVVDCDDASAIGKVAPIDGGTVNVMTRRGQHFYYKYVPGFKTSANPESKIDVRNDGGLIVAPPSVKSATGICYTWLKTPDGKAIQEMPVELHNLLRGIYPTRKIKPIIEVDDYEGYVQEGGRDNALYHIALVLLRGGMEFEEVLSVASAFGVSCCSPPFEPAEAAKRVESAINKYKADSVIPNVDTWLKDSLSAGESFTLAQAYSELNVFTGTQKLETRKAIKKHVTDGLLAAKKTGTYSVIDRTEKELDYNNVKYDLYDIDLPMDISDLASIAPKNVIMVSGCRNAGKSLFMLDTIRRNMNKHECHYFCSEGGAQELKGRLERWDMPLDRWNFKAWERNDDFASVIKPDALNVIDFLEMHDNFYLVAQKIKEIYNALGSGIAMIGLQKNSKKDVGMGGELSLDAARLAINIEQGFMFIKKAKIWKTTFDPNGSSRDFTIINGTRFKPANDWEHSERYKTDGGKGGWK